MDNVTKKRSHDKIYLRSEKVQNILGEEPSVILKWGITIILIIFIVLICLILMLKYPYGLGETILEHILSSVFFGDKMMEFSIC